MYGTSIEVFADLNADTTVIVSDTDRFDENIYDLKVE